MTMVAGDTATGALGGMAAEARVGCAGITIRVTAVKNRIVRLPKTMLMRKSPKGSRFL
jgi:hypothetical protein